MDIDDDYQKSTVNVINESSQRYDSIAKYSRTIECDKNCTIGDSLINDNIHYEGHIIRYLKSQCEIDNLNTGNVLLGDLEKVGLVVILNI